MTNPDLAIEHQNVPDAHQGLHGFLYSSEDEHAVAETALQPELANIGDCIVPLESWCQLFTKVKLAGVYAVLDRDRRTQYIGYSRNIWLSLNGHVAQVGKETCALVRVQTFKFPKREEMEKLRDAWLAELNYIPAGNSESAKWATTVREASQAAMSEAARIAYAEKKLKLQKAMDDPTLKHQQESDASDIERRQHLEAAVSQGDWSVVIDGQTQETMPS